MPAFINHLPALLARLDELWAAQGAPIARYAAPGLSDEEIDHLAEQAGIVVPPELRIWWGWHNGVLDPDPGELDAAQMVTYLDLISLQTALELRQGNLDIPRPDPTDPVMREWYWRESWLPVISSGNLSHYVDTNIITEGKTTPVFRVDAMWASGWNVPVTSSFTAAVATIVRTLEAGHFSWSKVEGAWVGEFLDLPSDIDPRFF